MTTTTASTSEIRGADGKPMPTPLSPEEFAQECRGLVEQCAGPLAHRRLDALVTTLLTSLGYGEGMEIFIAAVKPYHDD